MKRGLLALLLLGLWACEDHRGVPRNGQEPELTQIIEGDGGIIFEYTNVHFTGPDFEVFLDYPSDFEGLNSDMHLVYFLWDVDEDANGDPLDIWRLLPQTILTPDGILQYNFDASAIDARVWMDAEFDLGILGSADTDDWVARVVVIPTENWGARIGFDKSNYAEVEKIVKEGF